MNKTLTKYLMDVKKYHKGCKSRLIFNCYKNRIDRAIASEGEKKIAVLELARLMEVKPE